jgi:hypothetical protein
MKRKAKAILAEARESADVQEPAIPIGCRELFDYAADLVTEKDIADFCMPDPGYPGYVRTFTTILASGIPPVVSDFEISETVILTRVGNPMDESDPLRFRRFRTFTNAVGVGICAGPEGPQDNGPNYLGISLLDDAYALQDSQLLRLLFPAFGELHRRLAGIEWIAGESPFFLLGQLVLAFMGFAPSADIAGLCDQLIAEGSRRYLFRSSPEFLWGCTGFDHSHHRWKHFVELSFPTGPANSSAALLRDAILYPPSEAG